MSIQGLPLLFRYRVMVRICVGVSVRVKVGDRIVVRVGVRN